MLISFSFCFLILKPESYRRCEHVYVNVLKLFELDAVSGNARLAQIFSIGFF